jgi:hypothetical protein
VTAPAGGASGLGTLLTAALPKGGLPSGQSVNVQFEFTVPTGGSYRFG